MENKKSQMFGGGIGIVLVAVFIGLFRFGDNLIRPAKRFFDDAGRIAARSSDELGSSSVRRANEGAESSNSGILRSFLEEGAQATVENADKLAQLTHSDDKADLGLERQLYFEGDILIRESTSTYRLKEDGYFHVSATRGVMEYQMTVNGERMPAEKDIDTEIPDEAKGEYERLQLNRTDDGRLYLIEGSRYQVDESHTFDLNIESEIEFVEGDWEQYLSGKQVTMRYTEDGLQSMKDSIERLFQRQFAAMFAASLSEEFGADASVDVNAKLTELPNATLSVSKNEIRSTQVGQAEVSLKIKATIEP